MERKVTTIAITIPRIPKRFPCLEVSGDDKPRKAKMKRTPDIKYNIADKLGDIT